MANKLHIQHVHVFGKDYSTRRALAFSPPLSPQLIPRSKTCMSSIPEKERGNSPVLPGHTHSPAKASAAHVMRQNPAGWVFGEVDDVTNIPASPLEWFLHNSGRAHNLKQSLPSDCTCSSVLQLPGWANGRKE